MNETISKVVLWAYDKGIVFQGNSKNQFLKTVEEVGEIGSALLKDDKDGIKDGIGDVLVTLIILAENEGMSIQECLDAAWSEIKDRKGKTVGGAFIKQTT